MLAAGWETFFEVLAALARAWNRFPPAPATDRLPPAARRPSGAMGPMGPMGPMKG